MRIGLFDCELFLFVNTFLSGVLFILFCPIHSFSFATIGCVCKSCGSRSFANIFGEGGGRCLNMKIHIS